MKRFTKIFRANIFEEAVVFLAGIDELENGNELVVKTGKGRNYIKSIGHNHIVINDDDGDEIYDLGKMQSSEELIDTLTDIYGNKVKNITVI